MQKRETQREEASRRGVSHGTIHNERKAQNVIDKLGEDCPIVYAWRWSNDDTCAKIGCCERASLLESRMVKTYHPTDDPILIGIMRCRSLEEAKDNSVLRALEGRGYPSAFTFTQDASVLLTFSASHAIIFTRELSLRVQKERFLESEWGGKFDSL